MHRLLAFLLIAALAGPALAQDQPKPLKTVRIHEPAPGMNTLYVIDADGTVPLAQLMLAIRGGTWKPAR
jgi:hypothetical protein